MKTVITDRSLSLFTLDEHAEPAHIFGYISALRDAGVRFVEMDFRTVMKMTELPDGVKYIFRVTDPVFLDMADAFDFDYMLITPLDYKTRIDARIPVIAELPGGITCVPQLVHFVNMQVGGRLSMIRLKRDFDMMSVEEAARYVNRMKAAVTVPLDFCPMNGKKNALDTAIKFSMAGADSITMTIGTSTNYASIEEYLFTLMSVYNTIPSELDMGAVCRAAVFHSIIFRNGRDSIRQIMRILDRDISGLINADTGERVKMSVTLRDTQLLHRSFVSALEHMAREENIPPDLVRDMTEAIRHYNVGVFNEELMRKDGGKGLLN
ncbi:MAG: hypothetical protein ACI4Q4_06580 [Oscillospiraceae bacterium]